MNEGPFLKALVGICLLMYLGILIFAGAVPASRQLVAPVSAVITLAGLLGAAFDKWIWSWPIISQLLKRPDLRGTWQGEILSEWVNPETGAKLPPIPAFACISQSATALHLRQFTKESESISLAANMVNEVDEGTSITVVYRNEPQVTVRTRSEMHLGGMRLRISGDAELSGHYWTDRQTRGHLTLRRVSRQRARSFEEAARLVTPK